MNIEGLSNQSKQISEGGFVESKEERVNLSLEILKKCSTYKYIADTKTKIYHKDSCECIRISNDLRGVGNKPEKVGFLPCAKCLPNKVLGKTINAQTRKKDKNKSKADIMKTEIVKVGEAYGMHVLVLGTTHVYVTTVVGEWYFCYNDRPIKLHHKNSEIRYAQNGDQINHYHIQDISFPSPTHALAYIRNHEQASIKRLMAEKQQV